MGAPLYDRLNQLRQAEVAARSVDIHDYCRSPESRGTRAQFILGTGENSIVGDVSVVAHAADCAASSIGANTPKQGRRARIGAVLTTARRRIRETKDLVRSEIAPALKGVLIQNHGGRKLLEILAVKYGVCRRQMSEYVNSGKPYEILGLMLIEEDHLLERFVATIKLLKARMGKLKEAVSVPRLRFRRRAGEAAHG
jgi:hypothetical protein